MCGSSSFLTLYDYFNHIHLHSCSPIIISQHTQPPTHMSKTIYDSAQGGRWPAFFNTYKHIVIELAQHIVVFACPVYLTQLT